MAAFTNLVAINKRRFLLYYRDALKRGITARNIISGFRKTSIWLFKPLEILDNLKAIVKEVKPLITPFIVLLPLL